MGARTQYRTVQRELPGTPWAGERVEAMLQVLSPLVLPCTFGHGSGRPCDWVLGPLWHDFGRPCGTV
eukprot:9444522-Pyramimonas_sp.AAC.1